MFHDHDSCLEIDNRTHDISRFSLDRAYHAEFDELCARVFSAFFLISTLQLPARQRCKRRSGGNARVQRRRAFVSLRDTLIDGWGERNKKVRREKGLSLEFDAISIFTRIYGDVAFLRARLNGFWGRFEVRLNRCLKKWIVLGQKDGDMNIFWVKERLGVEEILFSFLFLLLFSRGMIIKNGNVMV